MIKVEEFTKEEIREHLIAGNTDIDLLVEYIVKINKAYNKLIDRCTELESILRMLGETK